MYRILIPHFSGPLSQHFKNYCFFVFFLNIHTRSNVVFSMENNSHGIILEQSVN